MVKDLRTAKSFNGKRYILYRSFSSKREADNQARVLRSERYVRVTKHTLGASSPFVARTVYAVWTRQKR